MAVQLTDLGHLTPAQRTIFATYVTLGDQLALEGRPGGTPAVILPAMTFKQAKAVDVACREMNDLIGRVQVAARHVMKARKEQHVAQYEVDNA